MGIALNDGALWCAWLTGSVLLAGYMRWPSEATPIRRRAGSLRRVLGGALGVGGTLRLGVMLAAGMWWATASGILTADVARVALGLVLGSATVVALANAGRRAALTLPWAGVLGAALGGGLVGLCGLLRVGARLLCHGGGV